MAIITGGAKGIGKAISLLFASEGAHVVIADVDYDSAYKLYKEIGDSSLPLKVDVSSKSEVENMVKTVVEKYGRIDILVNNAGIQTEKPFVDLTEEEWRKVLDVNLNGAFFCSQAVAKVMIAKKTEGVIINISSIHGYIPRIKKVHYDASKAGLIMLTKETALELAIHNIRVNCIAPGIIDTPMNKELLKDPKTREKMEQRVRLKKIGKPEDVAKLALFLASEDSSYITGAVIPVDGGLALKP